MKAKLQRTFTPTPADIDRSWYVVDAEGIPLGRLASEVAQILRGKHKPTYAPHMDMGDYVIVVNAGKVAVTGNKETDKVYYRHSGFPGGLRSRQPRLRADRTSRTSRAERRQGHDPEEPTRSPDAHQAQGLRRRGSSARGPETTTAHAHIWKG